MSFSRMGLEDECIIFRILDTPHGFILAVEIVVREVETSQGG